MPASRPRTSGSRWNGTCAAAWPAAATASSARCWSAGTARWSATPRPLPWSRSRAVMKTKPRLAVWKLASCDGCQLTLLDCEDELLAVAGAVEIAHFTEASSTDVEGPYDVSLVEGSVTTERDARRIAEIRAASRFLVAIGACATAGGIQALR